jgi:hypothetical protein
MTGNYTIQEAVERICAKGCRAVRRDIADLERGKLVSEVWKLNPEERREVLAELKKIMAVYGDECRMPE